MTDPIAEPLASLVQAEGLCPHCKQSKFRRGNHCNKCGKYIDPMPEIPLEFDRTNHAGQGKTWDSKLHKYVINKK